MGTQTLRVFLFLFIALAAACADTAESAQHSNETSGSDTLSAASIPPAIAKDVIFDISTIATAEPDSLRGVEVVAVRVRVDEIVDRGFWVTPVDRKERIFIFPAEGSLITVRVGEFVSVHGDVRLARSLMDGHQIPGRYFRSLMPYVYAYTVRPAWPKDKQPGAVPAVVRLERRESPQ
jgi:hypothetical protein